MVGYRGVPSKETLSSVPEIQRYLIISTGTGCKSVAGLKLFSLVLIHLVT